MIETPRDNRRSTSRWLAGIALLGVSLGLVSSVSAQEALSSELVPVDAFVADSSDLSMSLRQVEYGIQVPYGFEQLMRENTPDGRFVRRSAGLWAVFPRSEYAATEGGYIATWPAGTYFHIGPPRRTTAEPASRGEVGDERRVQPESQGSPVHTELLVLNPIRAEASDGRFAANETERPDPVRPIVQQRQPPRHIELVQVRFIMDEAYRRERMQSLVLQAQAARGPSSSPSK
jgi:hypothetical protein